MHLGFQWLFVFSFVFTACTSSKSGSSGIDNRLHDIWALEVLEGTSWSELNAVGKTNRQPTIELYVQDKKMIGNDGCNRISSKLHLEGEHIEFVGMVSTKMACPNAPWSNQFSRALEKVKKYKLQELKLIFLDASKNPIIQLRKVD